MTETTTKTAKIDRTRLASLLAMLESNHDGEVLNAARLACRLLRSNNLTWRDILKEEAYDSAFVSQVASKAYEAGKQDATLPQSFPAFARIILSTYAADISEWETDFLTSWSTKKYPPTDKQLTIFQRLSERFNIPLAGPSARPEWQKPRTKDQ